MLLQNVTVGDIDSDWPGAVAEYIRHNDEAVLRAITDKLLSAYQDDYLTCGSFDEFCDVAGKPKNLANYFLPKFCDISLILFLFTFM